MATASKCPVRIAGFLAFPDCNGKRDGMGRRVSCIVLWLHVGCVARLFPCVLEIRLMDCGLGGVEVRDNGSGISSDDLDVLGAVCSGRGPLGQGQ